MNLVFKEINLKISNKFPLESCINCLFLLYTYYTVLTFNLVLGHKKMPWKCYFMGSTFMGLFLGHFSDSVKAM